VPLGIYSKIHDVQALLILSVLAGAFHLVLGFLLGIRNVRVAHGVTLAIEEKAAWLFLLAGGLVAFYGSTFTDTLGITQTGWIVVGSGLGIILVSIILLWRGAAKVIGMGWIAVMEIFGLVGNFVSYTRLAAIGASKAGMVIALNAIGFTIIGGGAAGWAIYLIGFALIIPLAILGAGLQSLRLQFVEFFSKFYTGGGRPYVPFGRRAP
jgi:V/A-type H+-transporting ATPase subunit I